jgi:hypothetical protein
MFLSWKSGYDEEVGVIRRYVAVFVGYQMLLPILILGLYGVNQGLEVLGSFQLLYFFYLLVARPYYLGVQNVLLVVNQLVGLLFTCLLIVEQYVSLSEQSISYAVLAVEGLLVGVGLLAFMRLYLHFKGNAKAFRKLHKEEERKQGKGSFSKKEFQNQQEELRQQREAVPTFGMRRRLQEEAEMD